MRDRWRCRLIACTSRHETLILRYRFGMQSVDKDVDVGRMSQTEESRPQIIKVFVGNAR
jgi:hypothetical protein